MKLSVLIEVLFLVLYFLISTFIGIWGSTKYMVLAVQVMLFLYALFSHSELKGLKAIIFSIFLPGYIFQYVAIFFSILIFKKQLLTKLTNENKIIKYIFAWGVISYVINQSIELNLLSLPFFVLSFFLPMLFFSLFVNVGKKYKQELMKYIKLITVISFSMAIIQYFLLGLRVDHVTGGLKSAHMLGFVACALFLFAINQLLLVRLKKLDLLDIIILLLSLPVAYISDSKYLIVFMFITLAITFVFLGINLWLRVGVIFVTISVMMLSSFQALIPERLNLSDKDSGANAVSTEKAIQLISISASGQLWAKTLNLYSLEPWVFYIGSGPGTVLSRAANSRAFDTMKKVNDVYGVNTNVEQVESKLPSFIPAKTSWVTKKHIKNLFQVDWNGSLYDYRSSIVSYIWEFGIIGIILISLYIYLMYGRVRYIIASMINKEYKYESLSYFSLVIFFLLNAFVAYYFEYTHQQMFVYSIMGLFFVKK